MKKIVCLKLCFVFAINALVVPLAHCGKKHYKLRPQRNKNYYLKNKKVNNRIKKQKGKNLKNHGSWKKE